VKDVPSTSSGRTDVVVGEAIRAAADRLAATSDTARLDAELLMAHALGLTRSDMLLRAMRDPAPEAFAALIERRAAHEPVAYITGEAEFYGLTLAVTPATLIPRGDSETLIEAALEHVCEHGREQGRVVDLGTGSGALLLALLANREGWQGVGIDASDNALAVATGNAAALGLAQRSAWYHRNWHTPGWAEDLGTFDLVLCNPPYVEVDAQLEPQVRDHEPASALFAGPEGLDDYRVLIPQLRVLLNPDGIAILEIGATQAEAVGALAAASGFTTTLRRDLAGRPRALILM
jgi:release factor glutamine methyltransferase